MKSDLEIAVELIDRLAARGAADPKFLPWRTRAEFNDYLVRDSAIDIAALKEPVTRSIPTRCAISRRSLSRHRAARWNCWSQNMERNGHDPLPAYIPPAYAQADAATLADYPLVLQTGLREKIVSPLALS